MLNNGKWAKVKIIIFLFNIYFSLAYNKEESIPTLHIYRQFILSPNEEKNGMGITQT